MFVRCYNYKKSVTCVAKAEDKVRHPTSTFACMVGKSETALPGQNDSHFGNIRTCFRIDGGKEAL